MMKLSSGEEVHSFLRVVGTENVEVDFNLLIGPFSLSIDLRVIYGGEFDIIVEELGQLSSKSRCKLWTSVRYQGIMESELFKHIMEEKFGHSSCIYVF